MQQIFRMAALSSIVLASACKPPHRSDLASSDGGSGPQPAANCPIKVDVEDDSAVFEAADSLTGCSENQLYEEALSVEKSAEQLNAERAQDVDSGIDQKLVAMGSRLARLHEERAKRNGFEPIRTAACVSISDGNVTACKIGSKVSDCTAPDVYYAEGSCTYFKLLTPYNGKQRGGCIKIDKFSATINSCEPDKTREACESGDHQDNRFVYRDSCDGFEVGQVFRDAASVAGGVRKNNGGGSSGGGSTGGGSTGGGSTGGGSTGGGGTNLDLFHERCSKAKGFPDGNLCYCRDNETPLAKDDTGAASISGCSISIRKVCEITKGKMDDKDGCICGGTTRYDVTAFPAVLRCNENNASPSLPTQPSPNQSAKGSCLNRSPATLVVTVPRADSRLRVNGAVLSQSSSKTYTLTTPRLCDDRDYRYRIALDDLAPVTAVMRAGKRTECSLPGRCRDPH